MNLMISTLFVGITCQHFQMPEETFNDEESHDEYESQSKTTKFMTSKMLNV